MGRIFTRETCRPTRVWLIRSCWTWAAWRGTVDVETSGDTRGATSGSRCERITSLTTGFTDCSVQRICSRRARDTLTTTFLAGNTSCLTRITLDWSCCCSITSCTTQFTACWSISWCETPSLTISAFRTSWFISVLSCWALSAVTWSCHRKRTFRTSVTPNGSSTGWVIACSTLGTWWGSRSWRVIALWANYTFSFPNARKTSRVARFTNVCSRFRSICASSAWTTCGWCWDRCISTCPALSAWSGSWDWWASRRTIKAIGQSRFIAKFTSWACSTGAWSRNSSISTFTTQNAFCRSLYRSTPCITVNARWGPIAGWIFARFTLSTFIVSLVIGITSWRTVCAVIWSR